MSIINVLNLLLVFHIVINASLAPSCDAYSLPATALLDDQQPSTTSWLFFQFHSSGNCNRSNNTKEDEIFHIVAIQEQRCIRDREFLFIYNGMQLNESTRNPSYMYIPITIDPPNSFHDTSLDDSVLGHIVVYNNPNCDGSDSEVLELLPVLSSLPSNTSKNADHDATALWAIDSCQIQQYDNGFVANAISLRLWSDIYSQLLRSPFSGTHALYE